MQHNNSHPYKRQLVPPPTPPTPLAKAPEPPSWSGFYKKSLKERQRLLKLAFPTVFSNTSVQSTKPSSTKELPSSALRTLSSTSQLPFVTRDKFMHSKRIDGVTTQNGSLEWSRSESLSLTVMDNGEYLNAEHKHGKTWMDRVVVERKEIEFKDNNEAWPINGLDEDIADHMSFNFGLALNFVINGKPLVIPMAIEEPSVIAAVSGAAKTISQAGGGFEATSPERNMILAQVVLLDVKVMDEAVDTLERERDAIIRFANTFIANMVSRGGGVTDVSVRRVRRRPNPNPRHSQSFASTRAVEEEGARSEWLVVHLHIDVCDAMGANCASTVAEGVAPFLAELTSGRIGVRIVSNLCVERMAKAAFRIPFPALRYKHYSGTDVARGILEAYEWAEDDPFRATTNNKGVMNGIDAVCIATGQDWRAIEAALHTWTSMEGRYRPLTRYWVEEEGEGEVKENWENASNEEREKKLVFCGEMQVPLTVGTKGGVLNTNPVYKHLLGLMGSPNSKDLAMILACVGLAQNFAALRALTTEGIQKGHMSLHAKNMAIAAGAPPHAIAHVTARMVESGRITLDAAREFVAAHGHLTTTTTVRSIVEAELVSEVRKGENGSGGYVEKFEKQVDMDIQCIQS
ncbi:hydroxymethylglutaryl-CoA reductase [Jimgerdemannia flammicorona]|uniref:hydroxymethylglutaryl-CoA reductase (NADPH) n=1 Tax=Jimgerdemannia flammicorona TaxID=994334 RepID=A0A433QJP0_9FUNG|nr:hydroxymethylglutaryl-CoA reductase [Jimgerdemannia flammicorona]